MLGELGIINRNFVHSHDFNEITVETVEKKETFETFKLLRLFNCGNLSEAVQKLSDDGIAVLLSTCSYLLILVLELNECQNEKWSSSSLIKLFNGKRPFIVNLICIDCKTGKIFHNENESNCPEEVDLENPPKWIVHLRNITTGSFGTNLMNTKLKKIRTNFVRAFTELGSHLSVRFEKLFNDSKDAEGDWKGVEGALNSMKIENFLAFMDLPFLTDQKELSLEKSKENTLKEVDPDNKSFLQLAVERNNIAVVQYLLQFDFEVDQLANLAAKLNFYECAFLLVEADSRFPKQFTLDEIDGNLKLKFEKLIEKRKIFHKAVSEGNFDLVKQFVKKNSKLRIAYDEKNKSALTVALMNKKFEIYTFLRSSKFSHGSVTDFKKVQESLSLDDKKTLREISKKYFQSYNAVHVLQMISKSRLALGNEQKNFSHIGSMFNDLDSMPETSAILNLVSQAENLIIVFDFESTSTKEMDPTKTECTRGSLYHKQETIYVAAKFYDSSYDELLGTLVHELTHFAMFLLFDNYCLPYKFGEESNDRYLEIFNESKKIYSDSPQAVEPVIRDAFENYPKELNQHAELIVRVVHVLIMFRNDSKRISNSQKMFSRLFECFDEILYEINLEVKLLPLRNQVKDINRYFTPILLNGESETKEITNVFEAEGDIFKLVSGSNLKSILEIIEHSVKSPKMFVNIDTLADYDLSEKIRKVLNSELKPYLIINCCNKMKKHSQMLVKILETYINSRRVLIVCTIKESILFKRDFATTLKLESVRV